MRFTTTFLSVRSFSALPKTSFSRLSNGLAVATVQTDSPLTTIGLSFRAGSAFETRATNGSTAVLQALAFKSKNKSKDFVKNIESNLGASLETSLDREQLSYFASVETSRAKDSLAALSANVQETITNDDFASARERVLGRVRSGPISGTEHLYDHLHTVAFQDGPHSLPARGSVESLGNLKKDDVLDQRKKIFVGSRGVVTAAGGLSHEEVVKAAEGALGNLPAGTNEESWSPFTGSMVRISDDELYTEAEMAYGYGGPGRADSDHDVIQLVHHLTGKWDRSKNSGHGSASRLVDSLVESKLGNRMESFYFPYAKVGLFGVYLHTPSDHNLRTDLPKLGVTYFVDLGQYLTDNELARAKAKYSSALLRGFDGPLRTFASVSRDVLQLGKARDLEADLKKIEGITKEDVKKALLKYTYDVDVSVAASGHLPSFPDYLYIRRWTYYNTL